MKQRIRPQILNILVDILDKDFKKVKKEFKVKGGEEDTIASCRLYGQMEYIKNGIKRINDEYDTKYKVPKIPYSPNR